MKSTLWLALIILTIVVALIWLYTGKINPHELTEADTSNIHLISNEEVINGLYSNLNLSDSKQVFRYVFSHLKDEVVIYPTENYYYFIFYAQGKTIWGSMSLFANDRDDGVFGFGYVAKIDKRKQQNYPLVGGGGNYNANDGVFVKKIDDFTYSVTFENSTVVFKLNDIGLEPPKKAKLRGDEIYVGPSFDESGLKFFLIFNKAEDHLYWVLNEDDFVPETFTDYTDNITIGDRTEFAFYMDEENNRKILIGAEGLNVLQNNWYDGPFDQMPDNYVYTGKIELKKYLEAHYPNIRGRIDKYGNYLDDRGTRIAVAPYMVYFSKEDLVSAVESAKNYSNNSMSKFYYYITQQVYEVPEDIYKAK